MNRPRAGVPRPSQLRAASFKSLYRRRAGASCSRTHSSVDARWRYSARASLRRNAAQLSGVGSMRRGVRDQHILGGLSATRSATCKAAENDCLERRNSIRPCVPSHVAYKSAHRPYWRRVRLAGFAQPRLQKRYGAFKASILIGLVWGTFHLWILSSRSEAECSWTRVCVLERPWSAAYTDAARLSMMRSKAKAAAHRRGLIKTMEAR